MSFDKDSFNIFAMDNLARAYDALEAKLCSYNPKDKRFAETRREISNLYQAYINELSFFPGPLEHFAAATGSPEVEIVPGYRDGIRVTDYSIGMPKELKFDTSTAELIRDRIVGTIHDHVIQECSTGLFEYITHRGVPVRVKRTVP